MGKWNQDVKSYRNISHDSYKMVGNPLGRFELCHEISEGTSDVKQAGPEIPTG